MCHVSPDPKWQRWVEHIWRTSTPSPMGMQSRDWSCAREAPLWAQVQKPPRNSFHLLLFIILRTSTEVHFLRSQSAYHYQTIRSINSKSYLLFNLLFTRQLESSYSVRRSSTPPSGSVQYASNCITNSLILPSNTC